MWTRRELKQQAKEALQRSYWKVVLVAFLMMLFGGNWIGSLFSTASGASNGAATAVVEESAPIDEDTLLQTEGEDEYSASAVPEEDGPVLFTYVITDDTDKIGETAGFILGAVIIFVVFLIVFLVMLALLLAYEIFLAFPLIVGAERFMLRSLEDRAEVKELAFAFDHSYRNVVKTMFHAQLSIFLWSLLFFIPGIYKQYQYRMVEYILAEHPDMYYKDVMRRSSEMMNGQKWRAFVLDLSFILWDFAGVLTCGVAHVLFVAPYQYLTNAALYRRLCMVQEGRLEAAAMISGE